MVFSTRRLKKIEDTFTRFDRIHEHDRRTHEQTDTQTLHDDIASRGKNRDFRPIFRFYVGNDMRYNHSYDGKPIENHVPGVNWYKF